MDRFFPPKILQQQFFKKIAYKEMSKTEFLQFHIIEECHQTVKCTTSEPLRLPPHPQPVIQKTCSAFKKDNDKNTFSHLYL